MNDELANFDGGTSPQLNPWAGKNSSLQTAWRYSTDRLLQLEKSLHKEVILTVGVAGSYARREAGPASDLDLVIVVEEGLTDGRAAEIDQKIRQQARDLGFRLPQSHGIFAEQVREEELFAPPIGQIDEAPRTFGLRIQWLLEMQPVQGETEFRRIQRRILERYATDFVTRSSDKQWIYLLNDTIRYFRSLFLKYQWESRDNPARWELRNLKGGHSRTILYAGLLCILGESGTRGDDKFEWLFERLKLTPLERIAAVYEQHGDSNLKVILQRYGDFIAWVNSTTSRAELGTNSVAGQSPEYLRWKENADLLQAELIRFVLNRREDWSPRFFQRLFF